MFSNNYGEIPAEPEDFELDEINDTYLADAPEGIYLEDDDTHNHDVGVPPRPPRFGDL